MDLVTCALFAAIISVLSQLIIPIGPVPISLSVFAIMLTSLLIDWKRSAIAVLVYILIGLAGLPVFAGFRAGPAVLFGPTGGFISTYIPMAILIALISSIPMPTKYMRLAVDFFACLVGLFICYTGGAIQFAFVMKTDLSSTLAISVYPFVVFDLVKALLATYGAYVLRRMLPYSIMFLAKKSE